MWSTDWKKGPLSKNGEVVVAQARTLFKKGDAEMAEALAAKMALKLIRDQGWRKVIVEGDAQIIIRALQQKIRRSHYVQLIIEDVIHLSASIEEIVFTFAFHQCNEVAHRLAKWVVASFSDELWLNECLVWLSDLIVTDISSII
ncbi:putative 4-hydroxy-4-methyl-2-oxoglutarate aldolase [Bienertia sinuspersici]